LPWKIAKICFKNITGSSGSFKCFGGKVSFNNLKFRLDVLFLRKLNRCGDKKACNIIDCLAKHPITKQNQIT
jgi:hypothetical protein